MFDLGKGRTRVSHPALLNDGKWHTVCSQEVYSSNLWCSLHFPDESCAFWGPACLVSDITSRGCKSLEAGLFFCFLGSRAFFTAQHPIDAQQLIAEGTRNVLNLTRSK
jgi:hypothetical protein